ncbi:predicted protein [Plenodomus lingam JN3]|uniref:Predicted protein n=2 Tax=Leptosphaeria maculans TaxID=5022 RepID=E4ZJN3_LEPMJ|nr:predicted protein [Plenodomus lingam JN3]CBX91318.1 predicted protein [Plenodomus lingam JN3]
MESSSNRGVEQSSIVDFWAIAQTTTTTQNKAAGRQAENSNLTNRVKNSTKSSTNDHTIAWRTIIVAYSRKEMAE